ncbi:hypothetical protein EA756_04305 [Acinetobacter lactucae]|uniref:N-acetyltransferase n=1 Tax=Acinetobacter lactucae TaxID=1785128 RepID=A0A429K6P5_9GAMM|nr:hypothetical protein [Acinetobacter lactucae]RSO59666.1 hypothetical protein EA756_04305 [Acinetobacter lactucae]
MKQNILDQLKSFGIPVKAPDEKIIYSDLLSSGQVLQISNGYSFEKSLSCDHNWKVYHENIFAYLKTLPQEEANDIINKLDYQDWHWEWVTKTAGTKTDNQYEWFFLEIDNCVEAACLIYFPKESALQPSENIFYIEFLAIAPWNRFTPLEEKRYRGLGSILLLRSVKFLAQKYANSGRFSLHSLAQAESYYVNKLKMQHLSINDKPSLKYFELPENVVNSVFGEVA